MTRFLQIWALLTFTVVFTFWSTLALGEVWRFEGVFKQYVLISTADKYFNRQ